MEDIDFNPRVYNFVLPSGYAESFYYWDLNSFEALCPNSEILLDHTLAVIWHTFALKSAELTNLNRADVVWALRFLESIDTKDAGDTTTLNGLIKLLRHILITRYALEDEKSMLNETQTFYDTTETDLNETSTSLEEYLSFEEVQEDLGKAASIASLPPSTKCTKEEMTQELKKLVENSPGMSIEELVQMLEKS